MYKAIIAASVAAYSHAYELEMIDNEPVSNSGKGFDISQPMSLSTAQCMKSNGYTTVLPRAWTSTGHVDTAACTSLNNAKSAGILNRDVYFFPCPTCSASASSQLNSMVSYLKSNCSGAWSTMIWLDVEGSQYWTGNTTSNRTWYQSLVNACAALGTSARCGVYSSYYNWESIFGSTSYVYGQSTTPQLWYAHYDNSASFSDFNSFGGWTKPWGKQYIGDATVCSMGVDVNYIPSQ